MRKGVALTAAGATYEEMVTALCADPETADWCREKGVPGGERQLKRIYEKATARLKLDGFELTEDGIARPSRPDMPAVFVSVTTPGRGSNGRGSGGRKTK